MVNPDKLTAALVMMNTRLLLFPLIVITFAPGPWMARFLLMSKRPPVVREIVPVKVLLNMMVSPAAEFAMAERSVPTVNPSLRFKTTFVAAYPSCDQLKPAETNAAIEIA